MNGLDIAATVIGWVILTCVCCYSIPQLVTVIKTKNTKGLSIVALILFAFCCVTMLAWGIGNAIRGATDIENPWPVWRVVVVLLPNILVNTLNSSANIISLVLKIKHVNMAKKMGIDEIKLAKILLKKAKEKKREK